MTTAEGGHHWAVVIWGLGCVQSPDLPILKWATKKPFYYVVLAVVALLHLFSSKMEGDNFLLQSSEVARVLLTV